MRVTGKHAFAITAMGFMLAAPLATSAHAGETPVPGTSASEGGVTPQGSFSDCTALSNGTLCVHTGWQQGNTIYVKDVYEKTGGGQIRARFGFNAKGDEYWDGGSFQQSRGQTKSYQWNRMPYRQGCPGVVGFLSVDGQGRFQTPPAFPC